MAETMLGQVTRAEETASAAIACDPLAEAGSEALMGGDLLTGGAESDAASTSNLRLIACAAVLAAATAFADYSLSAGIAGGVLHVALVLLGWWATTQGRVALLATLASALVIAGLTAKLGDGESQALLINRALALLAIWSTAALLMAVKRREARLSAGQGALMTRLIEEEAHSAAIRAQAELAHRNTSDFLSNMSHELRTPLNAIIGFSEIIKDEIFGPIGSARYRDYMGDISESGKHLLALVEKLLDIAKVETGRAVLKDRALDVPVLLRGAVAQHREAAKAGEVTVELQAPRGLPLLRADERMLRKILTNVLSNAIKFTPPGGRVLISAWSSPEAGYVVQFTDSGIGIALEDVALALTPFGKAPGVARKIPKNQVSHGTGLGLSLVKSFVELHAGSLDLQSEPGTGTTVTLRFPAERIMAAVDAD